VFAGLSGTEGLKLAALHPGDPDPGQARTLAGAVPALPPGRLSPTDYAARQLPSARPHHRRRMHRRSIRRRTHGQNTRMAALHSP